MVYKALLFALFTLALTLEMATPEQRSGMRSTQGHSLPIPPHADLPSFPTVRSITVCTTLISFYLTKSCHSQALGSKITGHINRKKGLFQVLFTLHLSATFVLFSPEIPNWPNTEAAETDSSLPHLSRVPL